MSDYDSQSIDIAFQEMKGLFEHTEARGRELLLKSQILLGVSGVLLTLWTNAVLRLFDEAPSGVITFLAVLGPPWIAHHWCALFYPVHYAGRS